MWSLSLITPPAAEPLDLTTEVYPHLRLEEALTPQVALLVGTIQAAREKCESFTQRQLITATWELSLDEWCEAHCYRDGKIYLPRPPLQQQVGTPVTAGVLSVKYLDSAGVEQTFGTDQYVIRAPQGPHAGAGFVSLAYAATWPALRSMPGAVKIRFTAGYGALYSDVPAALRAGMLLTIAELDTTREEQTSGTIVSPNVIRAEGLWSPFRQW